MNKEMLTFGDTEFEKNKFYCLKNPIFLEDVDIEKVLVPNKISSSEKFINTLLITCIMSKDITYNAFQNKHSCKTL